MGLRKCVLERESRSENHSLEKSVRQLRTPTKPRASSADCLIIESEAFPHNDLDSRQTAPETQTIRQIGRFCASNITLCLIWGSFLCLLCQSHLSRFYFLVNLFDCAFELES